MLWTISDLHLSSVQPKPMDIFGSRWRNHPERIAAAWRERVGPEDVVLVAGDISWAMRLEQALPDLLWLDALPGRKVLCKGNHDYWWDRAGPLRPRLPPSIAVVEADAHDAGEAVICGTRGWVAPGTPGFVPETDMRIYNRELGRLDRALAAAGKLAADGRPIVVMIHYPPFIDGRPTEFARRISAAGAAACVYGHLHRPEDWAAATQGLVDGVYYQLSACDYLGFGPVAVRGLPAPDQSLHSPPAAPQANGDGS
ncbi:MAG: metallophosphoesterase [Chloroflexota bacterium]|nr:MAG: metallophosphoesterase [Chloroflexota bacterium]